MAVRQASGRRSIDGCSLCIGGAVIFAWLLVGTAGWREWRQTQRNHALLTAIRRNDRLAVTNALEGGADVNAADVHSLWEMLWPPSQDTARRLETKRAQRFPTALMLAVGSRDEPAIINALLQRGANPRVGNRRGQTALHLAAQNSDLTTATALLDCHADVNARDAEGNTPLIEAAGEEGSDMALLLMARGADIRQRNNRGENALDRARQSENIQAMVALQQAQSGR